MSDNIAIQVKNVTKVYHLYDKSQDRFKEVLHPFRKSYHHDFFAINDISFEIKKGETVGIIGKNGAGKSTFVKVLYGLLKPDEGFMYFNDNLLNIQSPSEARQKKIGMVFQHFSLFDSLTVRENLILGIDQDMSFSDLQKKVNNISEKYQLPLDLDAPINTLSAGQKQRVEIVRILLQDPELLIMDEPTSVLTPQEVKSLFKTLDKLLKEGRTILYITHKLEEVINLCDEVTILRDGAVIDSSKLESTLLKLNCEKSYQLLQWHAVLGFSETVRMTGEWYQTFYNKKHNSMAVTTSRQIKKYTEKAIQSNLAWTQ